MWEIIATILAFIGTIGLFIVKRTLNTLDKKLDNFDIKIDNLEIETKNIVLLAQTLETHKERLDSTTRDHNHLEDSLEKISTNLSVHNSTMAALKENVNGLRELLQHIIATNLLVKKK